MKQRLLVAAVGVPLLIVILVFLPPVATALLVCGIAGVAAYELLHTAGKHISSLVYVLTIVMSVLTVLVCAQDTWLLHDAKPYAVPAGQLCVLIYAVCAFLYVMALFFVAVHTHGLENAMPFGSVAVCIVGAFVFPAMYSCIARLRGISPVLVLMPFVVAFIGDSASMLGGMAFGHKKFAPRVSPNKTWAGFLAGPVGSALGMVILGLVARAAWQMTLPLWYLALIGVVANVFGQLGDLSMSLIKREAGVKDYSHIFLTHGGMLDRFDSSMFLSPVVYGMVMLLGAVA